MQPKQIDAMLKTIFKGKRLIQQNINFYLQVRINIITVVKVSCEISSHRMRKNALRDLEGADMVAINL